METAKKPKDKGKWIHSACAMCLAAPMKVKVRKGRIVEVSGEDIPGWNGKLCGKAIAGIGGRIYAPDRILYPQKRVGERGEGKFIRCSWEEVIDALAEKLKAYIDAGHPEYFEIWWGCPVQQDNLPFIHYWSAVVKSGISYMHGQVCYGDHNVEKIVTFGNNHSQDLITGVADWPRTKYAVIAGQNFPGTGGHHGGTCNVPIYPLANKARENGCKFVIIDPKLADSSAWCDQWVPIGPGNDDIFALSIAHVLVKENLYDEDFLLKYTNAPQLIRDDNGQTLGDRERGYLVWNAVTNLAEAIPDAGESKGLTLGLGQIFEVLEGEKVIKCKTAFQMFAEAVENYPPEATELPEKTVEIARKLGSNKPSVIFFPGFTSGRYPNWFQTMRAYSVVNLILGNFDRPGGFYFIKHRFNLAGKKPGISVGWPEPPEVPEYHEGLNLVPGPGGSLMSAKNIDKEPCYREPREFHPGTLSLPWLHFDAIEQGKLRAVLSTAENAACTQTDLKWVWECLKKLDLIIVGDQLTKEFVDLADYVIPEAAYLERYHLYNATVMADDDMEHQLLYMRSAAIPPQGDSKPLSWFLVEVAKRAGLGEYFENLDLDYGWWDRAIKRAGLYHKATPRKLVEDGPYVEDYPISYNLLFKPINTPSGRFEVYSNDLAEECYYNPKSRWHGNRHVYPLPIHVQIAEPKGDDEFFLIAGKATWHQKSATQQNRYLMENAIDGGCPYTAIYINADRAKKLGIKSGDLVEVECVGPTKKDDPCVHNEAAIGNRERAKVEVTEGLHPKAAWVYFAGGHKGKSMLAKAKEGITMNWLVPSSVSPYSGGVGKSYSIVKIHTVREGV